jgi:DHA2 family multidrug resistance protein
MSTLRNEQMGNGTGIFNLMRNLGGSAGIALVTTLLARGAQAHQAAMVAHMTPYDAPYRQNLHALTSAFSSAVGAVQASGQALAVMYAQLLRQAALSAYVDDFRLLAFLCLICIPALPLFHRSHKTADISAMH